jgi:hypothetical protein
VEESDIHEMKYNDAPLRGSTVDSSWLTAAGAS